jgi:hypothetical protein
MFDDKEYLAIEKKTLKFQEDYASKKDSKMYSTKFLEEMETALQNDVQKFYDRLQTESEAKIEELKDIQAKKQADAKIDPTEELLKRQDIQMKLELAADYELEDMVKNYIETAEGDKTELDFLRLELRKRGLKDKKEKELDLKLNVYMKEYNITEQWKNAPEYQAAEAQLGLLSQVRKTGMLHITDGEEKRAVLLNVEPSKSYFK